MSARSVLPHPEPLSGASYSAVELMPEGDVVVLLDQRRLPRYEEYVEFREATTVARAIRDMVVRGAPAIGIAAAYGMALAARHGRVALQSAALELKAARPTAVNLAWAVDRMLHASEHYAQGDLVDGLAAEARQIHRKDVTANRLMGEFGAELVPEGATILTHCNAGALATGGFGTALGVIRTAHARGKVREVLADETRPWLQGARLTAWELHRDGVPVTVISDGSAGSHFARGAIDLAIVGADRIAQNGDVANKIGTYTVACLARHHERPLVVVAPWSTVDLRCASGTAIPIEERPAAELTHFGGERVTPEGVGAHNPSFDVTPAELVSAIITERGIAAPACLAGLERLAALGQFRR